MPESAKQKTEPSKPGEPAGEELIDMGVPPPPEDTDSEDDTLHGVGTKMPSYDLEPSKKSKINLDPSKKSRVTLEYSKKIKNSVDPSRKSKILKVAV
ncbi:hypothetical protein L596_013180 [Steinernema carpocapsae]|nr:hypothetical protein L596_013180 [Steinernema carpocapsae]